MKALSIVVALLLVVAGGSLIEADEYILGFMFIACGLFILSIKGEKKQAS